MGEPMSDGTRLFIDVMGCLAWVGIIGYMIAFAVSAFRDDD
jgi:hypothetical protein